MLAQQIVAAVVVVVALDRQRKATAQQAVLVL